MNALTIYILASLSFVIATIMELAIILIINHGNTKPRPNDSFPNRINVTEAGMTKQHSKLENDVMRKPEGKRVWLTKKIDTLALFCFIIFYALFNIFYFLHFS